MRAGGFSCQCPVLHLVRVTRVRAFLQLDFFSYLFVSSFSFCSSPKYCRSISFLLTSLAHALYSPEPSP